MFKVCSVFNAYRVIVMMTEKCTLCRQPYKCRHTSGRDLHDPLAISEDAENKGYCLVRRMVASAFDSRVEQSITGLFSAFENIPVVLLPKLEHNQRP
uniref:SFRICE_018906 n=1 Tax=Spodoptera frugiperda TaxID=7108 RepID=A0A2H1WNH4_SPOFR